MNQRRCFVWVWVFFYHAAVGEERRDESQSYEMNEGAYTSFENAKEKYVNGYAGV